LSASRRQFLSAALVGMARKTDRPIAGRFVNESPTLGHELRHHGQDFKRPQRTGKIPLVIVGGGIAGLSAAWRLDQRGFRDFVLLEMEKETGGNSRCGENEISAYPWAAHYLPVPGKNSAPLVRELCGELGLYRNGRWDERVLCHSPQERLYIHGRWQEGLEPESGATRKDHQQYQRFEERMTGFRASRQFTIPMEAGAKPSPLDGISMTGWMRQQGFDSPHLNWYVDYCCRDDYGAKAAATSAWAGVHYFASRDPEDKGPLAWPEGNGWIVRELLKRVGKYVRTSSIVYRIRPDGARYRVTTEAVEYLAEAVIFAAPTFLAPWVVEPPPAVRGFEYSPWFTANLTLDRMPAEREIGLAWDNVIFDSPSLGYVDATHQSLRLHQERSVWTFYWAMAEGSAIENRRRMLDNRDWEYWKEMVLHDLARAHPDIRECVARIDIMRMGHAMVRPQVGFIFSESRRRLARPAGRLVYANSDLSGFSIFEEAQYRGVRAAEHVLRRLGR
jgi:hypothetical protein